jgi:hypothetical protein
MPKATFKRPGQDPKTAFFKSPTNIGDLAAWQRAACKALGLYTPKLPVDPIVTEGSIIFNYGTSALVIDRDFPYQLSGKY